MAKKIKKRINEGLIKALREVNFSKTVSKQKLLDKFDVNTAESRKNEPKFSLPDVKKHLKKTGKL